METYTVGPRKVTKLSSRCIGVYLPKELSFLVGKKVIVTLKPLKKPRGEEDEED